MCPTIYLDHEYQSLTLVRLALKNLIGEIDFFNELIPFDSNDPCMSGDEVIEGLRRAISEVIPHFDNLINLRENYLFPWAVKNVMLRLDIALARSKKLVDVYFTEQLEKIENYLNKLKKSVKI